MSSLTTLVPPAANVRGPIVAVPAPGVYDKLPSSIQLLVARPSSVSKPPMPPTTKVSSAAVNPTFVETHIEDMPVASPSTAGLVVSWNTWVMM